MIKFLSSVKLAVGLITALIISSIFATIYPDLNVYSSFWFRGLILSFTVNLLVCTTIRIPILFKTIKKLPSKITENPNSIEIAVDDLETCETKIKSYFKSSKYQVREERGLNDIKLLAQKGTLNLFAPHILHLALIIVLIGAFLGSFGAKDKVLCYVGQKQDLPAEVADMTIEVNDFQTLYDEEGAVANWVTDFNIYIDNEKVKTGETKVNYPLKYKGVVFYQSSYGYNHLVQVTGNLQDAYAIPDGKIFKLGDLFFNIKNLKDGPLLKVYKGHDVIKSQILKAGDKVELADNTTLEYLQPYPYTVLSVKKDPGTTVVMLGFLIMTLASALFWTGRYREVKILIKKNEKKVAFNVICKNKEIKLAITEDITRVLQEV